MPAGATGLTVKIACVRSRTLLNLSAAVPIKLSDEAFRPERGQKRMTLAGGDLIGKQFAGDQAESGTAMAEGNEIARYGLQFAENRLAIPGMGLGPTP